MHFIIALLVLLALVLALGYALFKVAKSRDRLVLKIARFRLDGYFLEEGPDVGDFPHRVAEELQRRGIYRSTHRVSNGPVINISFVDPTQEGVMCDYRVEGRDGSPTLRLRSDVVRQRRGNVLDQLAFEVAEDIVWRVAQAPLR